MQSLCEQSTHGRTKTLSHFQHVLKKCIAVYFELNRRNVTLACKRYYSEYLMYKVQWLAATSERQGSQFLGYRAEFSGGNVDLVYTASYKYTPV